MSGACVCVIDMSNHRVWDVWDVIGVRGEWNHVRRVDVRRRCRALATQWYGYMSGAALCAVFEVRLSCATVAGRGCQCAQLARSDAGRVHSMHSRQRAGGPDTRARAFPAPGGVGSPCSFGAGVSRARCGAGARRGTESTIMPAARRNIERYLYFSRLIPKTISISRHIVLAAAADPRRGKFAAPRAARRCGIVGTVPASTTTRVRVPGWHGLGAIYEEILPECPIEPCSERVALEPIVDGNVELAFLCV